MKQKQDQGQSSDSPEVQRSSGIRVNQITLRQSLWTQEELRAKLGNWAPQYMDNEEDLDAEADCLKNEGLYDTFREAFRSMLLDPSRTLSEKANYYFEDFEKDAPLSPWGYFKFLWERLFPHEPFPIAVDPDPPREF